MLNLTIENKHRHLFRAPPLPQLSTSSITTDQRVSLLMSIRAIKQFIRLICLLFISLQCSAFPTYMTSEHKAPSSEKINNWLKLANNNNADAQFELGIAYQEGNGVTKDLDQARHWYKKAADAGITGAQNNLGCLLIESDSGPEKITEGVSLLEKAAKANSVHAQMNLAELLIDGTRVKRDYKKAFNWSLKAAELSNDPEAQYMLGILYEQGAGTETDYAKAADFFTLAS
ncbi:hypothetical protein MNBD_GAMMA11-1119, partial [hydrothermal vent metagenome]